MGHFGGMGDMRDMGGRETSTSSGIFDEDLTRTVPPMTDISVGPQQSRFGGGNLANPHGVHGVTTSSRQGIPATIENGPAEREKITQRDKDAIYS